MKIKIDEIKRTAKTLAAEEPVESFPELSAVQQSGEFTFLSPLDIRVDVTKEYDHVRAHGQVSTSLLVTCSRCLAEYRLEVAPVFTIFYTRATRVVQDEEEIELADEDLVSVTYEGDEIDFNHEIADQVLMEIPLKPLCKEECLGLCSSCGTDLNRGDCGCDRSRYNFKFNALQNFKVTK